MKLGDLAITVCGDKGDVANLAAFPIDEADWELLRRCLTADVVKAKFASLVKGEVRRYEFVASKGLNFVMDRALDGGVSVSLRTDPHGKSYMDLMSDIDIDIDIDERSTSTSTKHEDEHPLESEGDRG